ncbi:MAG: hypothetical protein QOG99_3763 [Frankiales bacterium]|nr:hypothetical protein [Frankiales bacterium]
MTDSGGDWTSPGGAPGSWQPPTYSPSYPQAPPPAPPPQPGGWQGWGPAWSPMPGVVPLRPLGVGEILDGGVKVIRRYPKPTLALSAVVSTVVALINIAFILVFQRSQALSTTTTSDGSFSSSYDASSLPGTVLNVLGGAMLTGALVTVVRRAVHGRPATVHDAWTATRPRLWALLGVAFMKGVIFVAPIAVVVVLVIAVSPIALLLILAVLPLEVWLWCVLALAPAPLVLERVGVFAALRRSRVLVMRSFWRTFLLLALCWLITTLLSSILVIPVVLVAELPLFTTGATTLGTTFFIVSAIVSGIAQTLIAPYSAGFRALLYVDLRMRTEGLDVALQSAAALPSTSAATGA